MSSKVAGSAGRRVIVLGGSSEIALAIVRELQLHAPREVVLVGRDTEALARSAEELRAAGCSRVETLTVNALDFERHGEVVGEAFAQLGGAEIVLLAVGTLGSERGGLPEDITAAVELLQTNVTGAGSLLMHAARHLRAAGAGTLVVLSSVAAERPRRANAVYAASKAGLDALAQGLADDLYEDGVRVVVVRPGFVHTRMTRGLDPAPLASTPGVVAATVVAGLDSGAQTIWAPRPVRLLMFVMRMIPRALFRRIKR